MNTLVEYINQFGSIDNQTNEKLLNYLKLEQLQKDEYFLEAGRYCNRIGFIKKGVFRIFFIDKDGNEITRYFLSEKQFIVDLSAYNNKTLASDNIQSLTESEIIVLDRMSMDTIPTFFKEWNNILHKITENALLEKMHHRSNLVNQDATAKYVEFLKLHPNLVNRIPLGYLASYLGIKQQSLSRIRKKIIRP